MMSREVPENLLEELLKVAPVDKAVATRASGGTILQRASELVPALVGGAADLAPSTKTDIKNADSFAPENYGGRNLHFGVRELAMGMAGNGMALYETLIPYTSTFFVFSDYMKPAIRLSAIQSLHQVYQSVIRNARGVVYIHNYEEKTFDFIDEGILELFDDNQNLKRPMDFKPSYLKSKIKNIIITDPDVEFPIDSRKYIHDFKNGKISRYFADMEILMRDGHRKWLSDSSIPYEMKEGRMTKSIGFIMDISDRVQAETDLLRSEQNFKSIFENISDVYYKSDMDNHISMISPCGLVICKV